jgi:hypothetical protein
VAADADAEGVGLADAGASVALTVGDADDALAAADDVAEPVAPE